MDTCANCGRQIGKLETPCVWRDAIVCQECYARISVTGTTSRQFGKYLRRWEKAILLLLVVGGVALAFWHSMNPGATSPNPGATSPGDSRITGDSRVTADDIYGFLTQEMPAIKATPTDGESQDEAMASALGDALTKKFAGCNLASFDIGSWTFQQRGAYKDGVVIEADAPDSAEKTIGNYSVTIDHLSADMTPSQTPQASALDKGVAVFVAGKVKTIDVFSMPDWKLLVDVTLENCEFR